MTCPGNSMAVWISRFVSTRRVHRLESNTGAFQNDSLKLGFWFSVSDRASMIPLGPLLHEGVNPQLAGARERSPSSAITVRTS